MAYAQTVGLLAKGTSVVLLCLVCTGLKLFCKEDVLIFTDAVKETYKRKNTESVSNSMYSLSFFLFFFTFLFFIF